MFTIGQFPNSVNPAIVSPAIRPACGVQSDRCAGPVPCSRAGFVHLSQWCDGCRNETYAGLDSATDFDRWLATDPTPEPTVEDTVTISPLAELEWLGFELGLEGEAVTGSAEYSDEERAAFERGHAAGFKAYTEEIDREYQDYLDRLEFAFGERDVHPCEVIEAIGAVQARKASRN